MSKREDKRRAYGEGWDTWNADLLFSSLTDDFVFDDPAMPEPVIKANMAEYMAGWKDRVKQLGGTGEIGSRDRVTIDKDGGNRLVALVVFCWYHYEGSAVTRTTDEGVQYERITYYPNTPEFTGKG